MKRFLITACMTLAAPAWAEDAPSREGGYGLGRTALPEEIAAWDIDIRPDGTGLPEGEGDVWTGEELFVDYCSACHGDFGEAVGRWPVLAGGWDTLDGEDPVKTIGSYWPYLSTVWDYVHRAMPYGNAQSLSDDEVYAITAYLMYLNNMVEDDFVLSSDNFLDIPMDNVAGFYMDDRDTTEYVEFSGEPCMSDCAEGVEVTMRAMVLDVTPETEGAEAAAAEPEPEPEDTGPDPELVAAGEGVFRQCSSCHQIGEGARNGAGPILNGIYGAPAGQQDGFRYSPALADSGLTWDDETLAAFLADPRGYLRGNRMGFRGLQSDDDIAAVIAYIQAAGGE